MSGNGYSRTTGKSVQRQNWLAHNVTTLNTSKETQEDMLLNELVMMQGSLTDDEDMVDNTSSVLAITALNARNTTETDSVRARYWDSGALLGNPLESPKGGKSIFSSEVVRTLQDRITCTWTYDAGPSGEIKPSNRSRVYLVACHCSEASLEAMDWAIQTLVRNGNELHVAMVISGKDGKIKQHDGVEDPESVLKTLNDRVKERLDGKPLFHVQATICVMYGNVRKKLHELIQNLNPATVVCGSQGRKNRVQGILNAPVSGFLIHNSLVPVVVIQTSRKAKKRQIRWTQCKLATQLRGMLGPVDSKIEEVDPAVVL
ncbi:hypothetical protein DFQ30_008583 [Apophysomyces sp. BC1015]|nr:hypothetical protein DFQ30_008583 [Apophysomyces sp. BC1015]KAG0180458.1 hypothetical protein DFQ29_000657 [Apophysomyces sp. BC1021]